MGDFPVESSVECSRKQEASKAKLSNGMRKNRARKKYFFIWIEKNRKSDTPSSIVVLIRKTNGK